MDKFLEILKEIFLFLWAENGYSVTCGIISTITAYILCTRWGRRSKLCHLFAASLLVLFNVPCLLHSASPWYLKGLAGLYILDGLINVIDVAKGRKVYRPDGKNAVIKDGIGDFFMNLFGLD